MLAHSFVLLLAQLTAFVAPSPTSLTKRAFQAKVYSSCKLANHVALTFDDGAYQYSRNISDQLTKAGAKGTFFMNGYNWDCIYDDAQISNIQYAYNAGHQVGDHTWSHADLTTFSAEQIEDGMYRMEQAFARILGVKPAFVRPPYGSYNDDLLEIAYKRGQSVAIWDTDTEDADGATVAYSKGVYDTAVSKKLNNMVVLNHETEATTAGQVLPYALKLLKAHGYQMVTLAECLGLPAYQSPTGKPQEKTSEWTCDNTPVPGKGCGGSIACQTGTVTV